MLEKFPAENENKNEAAAPFIPTPDVAANRARIEKRDLEKGAADIAGNILRAEAAVGRLADADFGNKAKYNDFNTPVMAAVEAAKALSVKKPRTNFSRYPEFLSAVQTLQAGLKDFKDRAYNGVFADMTTLKTEFENQKNLTQKVVEIAKDLAPEEKAS